jgi:uncharacterized protein (DUF433 family)
MQGTVDISSLLTRDSQKHGGRPCIRDTGTSILAIVELFEMGVAPIDIQRLHFPDVPLAGIFAALAYWAANPAEVERYFREDADAHDALFGSPSE